MLKHQNVVCKPKDTTQGSVVCHKAPTTRHKTRPSEICFLAFERNNHTLKIGYTMFWSCFCHRWWPTSDSETCKGLLSGTLHTEWSFTVTVDMKSLGPKHMETDLG